MCTYLVVFLAETRRYNIVRGHECMHVCVLAT